MGKKSKRGVSRAGTKHSAAGSSKNKQRSKSDGASVASKASRDAISLDNPEIAPSTLPAPRGPPPQDVVAFLNTLLQQQAAVNAPNSNAGDHLFDKENSVTVAAATDEPEIKQEATKQKEATTEAPLPMAAEAALEEDEKKKPTVPMVNAVMIEEAVAPVAEVRNVEEVRDAITKPKVTLTDAPVVEVTTLMAETVAAPPAVAIVQVADPAIEHLSTKKETVAPAIDTQRAAEPKAEIAVAEPEIKKVATVAEGRVFPPAVEDLLTKATVASVVASPAVEELKADTSVVAPEIKKVAPVAEDSALVLPNADESAIEVQKAPEEEKIDVWSSKLRDVVEEKKPVMDVTPPRSREEKKNPVIDATPQKSRAVDASVPTLDTPDAKEIAVKQNDCGCVIL